jgi:hypothetical protein
MKEEAVRNKPRANIAQQNGIPGVSSLPAGKAPYVPSQAELEEAVRKAAEVNAAGALSRLRRSGKRGK